MAAPRRIARAHPRLCGVTDQGRVRDRNEDAFHLADDGRVLIVADGMGGHQAGEVASALAVARVAEYLSGERRQKMDAGQETVELVLGAALEEAHQAVALAGQDAGPYAGMGTTLIVAYLSGDDLYTCHVGDVRGYLQHAACLEQITHDHSLVGEWVRMGRLTRGEARVHPARNQVRQALGASARIAPEVHRRRLAPDDVVLLCTDGLWGALHDDEVAAILGGREALLERAVRLVDRACEAGGEDNITVVVYKHA